MKCKNNFIMKLMKTHTNKIVRITDKLNANFEGFTIGTEGEKPKKRYIVGGYTNNKIKGLKYLSFAWCPANIRGQKIFNFVEKNFLFASCNPVFFGTWYDGEVIYLDICKEFDNLGEALKEGKENKQICIYDQLKEKEIYI